MNEQLELAIALWYKEWLLTHDPWEDEFMDELQKHFPDLSFTYYPKDLKYVIV